ncbi:MAG: hypothetical protein IT196_08030 [Acidimicrobiales bacterium]|nr:hypothetical protein [Acidimicrobiales bacterium]
MATAKHAHSSSKVRASAARMSGSRSASSAAKLPNRQPGTQPVERACSRRTRSNATAYRSMRSANVPGLPNDGMITSARTRSQARSSIASANACFEGHQW